jgi:hypothetical protein
MKEILHEYATTVKGLLIRVNVAKKGEDYFCPGCKDKFILKNSGKTGKGSRRPHFAHNNLEGSCSHESYLHNTFKIKTLELIKDQIRNALPININWRCDYCKNEHNANLFIFDAKAEFNMKERTPDIALFNQFGNVFAVIEIIYKHPPEDGTIKFYRENKIVLIQIIISSDDDLENVDNKVKFPTSVDYCLVPQVQTPRLPIPVRAPTTNYRNPNRVPRDFLNNPQKYGSKNGKIYQKRHWRKK